MLTWGVALTNTERQARWRAKHPEAAAARLAALNAAKRKRRCGHDPARCREAAAGELTIYVCHDCGCVVYDGAELADYRDVHGIRGKGKSS